MFKGVKKKKKFEEVLDQIKELLRTKKLKTGQKLPTEIELSESMGISRSSLREALTILSILGIVEGKSGEGTIIKQAQPENLKSIMSLVVVSKGLDMHELFETRVLIEKEAAGLAAKKRHDSDLQNIFHILSEAEQKYSKITEGEQADFDFLFHKSIVEASQNRMLSVLVEVISDLLEEQIRTTRSELATSPQVLQRFQNEHWMIYESIKNSHAEEASQLMEDHLVNSQVGIDILREKNDKSKV